MTILQYLKLRLKALQERRRELTPDEYNYRKRRLLMASMLASANKHKRKVRA